MTSRRVRSATALTVAALGLALVPVRGDAVQASSSSVSAGYTVGTVTVTPPGIPGLLALCAPTTWSYSSMDMPASLVTIDLRGTFFPWNVSMGMSVAGCENANGGAGSVTGGSITGSDPGGGTLDCTFTGGSYTRVGAILSTTINATCSTDGVVGAPITFMLTGAWVPNLTELQGVLNLITQATLAGALDSTPT